ncbi:hypothetical protein Hypma_013398 [Hypsizygus marmoreus]|uniref:Uncharacterized protein n=1 Tax=Hypsizygus marmoreus TaxID=39966 RepID=A0A369JBT6_HYPMA|nr:hypothetical protein Hypma_013398 [Hypsizygus marmoreus]
MLTTLKEKPVVMRKRISKTNIAEIDRPRAGEDVEKKSENHIHVKHAEEMPVFLCPPPGKSGNDRTGAKTSAIRHQEE